MKTHSAFDKALRHTISLAYLCFIFSPSAVWADFLPPTPSPYSFGPEGRPVEEIQQYGKPVDMVNILPNRPVAAKDKYGNRVYYTATGSLILSVGTDGKMTFSLSGKSKEKDVNGNIISVTESVRGTNKVVIKDGNGTITGYKEMGMGGKVLATYDSEGNLTKTYVYNKYGKTVQWTLDELSLTKTVFDSQGKALYDQNYEGAVVANYYYDKDNKISYKVDQYNNKSYFDDKGNLTYTEKTESNGSQTIAQYFYKYDDEGRYVLDKMVDLTPGDTEGDITYFKDGLAQYTLSHLGGTTKEYYYNGKTLSYVYDARTNETTWYDVNGKEKSTTYNGYVIKEWLYCQSRLVGYYDYNNSAIILYQYEREDQTATVIQSDDVPTAKEIETYYEVNGLMGAVGTVDLGIDSSRATSRKANIFDSTTADTKAKTTNTSVNLIANEAASGLTSDKDLVTTSKYNYGADGKLNSIITTDSNDATGKVTQLYIGTTGNNRISITVTGDQSGNNALAEELWDAIVNDGKSIADIGASDSKLAAFASSVKSIDIPTAKLTGLSDTQIANIMGWDESASGTASYVTDVKTRVTNAGANGSVSITYGYDTESGNNRIYASAVKASTELGMVVSGLYAGKMLDLTTHEGYETVTSADAAQLTDLYLNTLTDSSNGLQTTINGVTRTYATNGNILSEVDNTTGDTTIYDQYGRASEVYSIDGILTNAYYYGDDGKLQCVKTWDSSIGYQTTFYIGSGSAASQTKITVDGDQTGNAALAEQLWDAIANGKNIAVLSEDTSVLATFAASVYSIQTRVDVIAALTDQQLCNLFGWSLSASDTAGYLSEIRSMSPGVEGSIIISYGYADDDSPIYAAKIESLTKDKTIATWINVISTDAHDGVVSTAYVTDTVTQTVNTAVETATKTTGLTLINGLTDTIISVLK